MRRLFIGLAAASLLLTTFPAFAQFGVEVGPGGVGVEVGRDRDYRRDRVYEGRREYREGDRYEGRRAYRAYDRDCRTTTIRRRMPDGTVMIRRINRC
jgi:hypothetical protein